MNSAFYSNYTVRNDKLYIGDCERHLKIYDIHQLQTPEKDFDLLDTWALSI
jgi:hypothetical protein